MNNRWKVFFSIWQPAFIIVASVTLSVSCAMAPMTGKVASTSRYRLAPAGDTSATSSSRPLGSGPAAHRHSKHKSRKDDWIGATKVDPDYTHIGFITAGDIDDNLNFSFFLRFLEQSGLQGDVNVHPQLDNRISFRVLGQDGSGLAHLPVHLYTSSGKHLISAYTGIDGRYVFFPAIDAPGFDFSAAPQTSLSYLLVKVGSRQQPVLQQRISLMDLNPSRTIQLQVPQLTPRAADKLDLMFVLDTTGSMGDELRYIRAELKNIIFRIRNKHRQLDIRFGLVVYRDKHDEYVVRHYGFTRSLDTMLARLSNQSASGGGDYPEAVHQAFRVALQQHWRRGRVKRIIYHVADAPPHADKIAQTLKLAARARQKNIQIYSLAGSGVQIQAEHVMRINSVITQGRYLFLTDDSGIGYAHKEPSIPCYQVTLLNELILRTLDSEISGYRIEPHHAELIRVVGNYSNGKCGYPAVVPGLQYPPYVQ